MELRHPSRSQAAQHQGVSAGVAEADAELLRALKEGPSSEVFKQLYDRHARPAYHLAFYLTRNHADAEEVVQESLLRLWLCVDSLTPGMGGWILRTAARKAMHLLRARSRRELAQSRLAPGQPRTPSPSETSEQIEGWARLGQELEALPLADRELICLHFAADLSFRQISSEIGIPSSTIKSRLQRILRDLRAALQKEGVAPAVLETLPLVAWLNQETPAASLAILRPRLVARLCERSGARSTPPGRGSWRSQAALVIPVAMGIAALGLALCSLTSGRPAGAPPGEPAVLRQGLGAPGQALEPAPAGDDLVLVDEFDRPELHPFWAEGAGRAGVRPGPSSLLLQAQSTPGANASASGLVEVGLRSQPIDLSGGRSARIELNTLAPDCSGPAGYAIAVHDQDGRRIWQCGKAVKPAPGKTYQVSDCFLDERGLVPSNYEALARGLSFLAPPPIQVALNLEPSSSGRSRLRRYKHIDPAPGRSAEEVRWDSRSETSTGGALTSFRVYCYVWVRDGASISWPLDRFKLTRTRRGASEPGP